MLYLFIDRAGWDFPKYLQILKEYDIYKAEEDYLNIKFEEPPDIGEFLDRLIQSLVVHSNVTVNYCVPKAPVISVIRPITERKQNCIWKVSLSNICITNNLEQNVHQSGDAMVASFRIEYLRL